MLVYLTYKLRFGGKDQKKEEVYKRNPEELCASLGSSLRRTEQFA